MTLITTTLFSAFAIALISSKVIIYLFGKHLLDIPNDRSSHTTPTPRGGGLAIVTGTVGALLFAFLAGHAVATVFLFLIPGLLMAAVGIIDDLINLNIKIRLGFQLAAGALVSGTALYHTDGSPLAAISLGIFAVIGIVWLTNLYNFMDGINGLAGLQTVFVCFSASFFFHLQGKHEEITHLLLLIGFASFGFLYWNFPKAKLFMGDVGSLFIGITLATLMVWTGRESFTTSCVWLILMCAFIADATYTLIVRATSGQKFYLPHRSHFYQKLAAKLNSHTQATLAITGFNIVWLLPIAAGLQLGRLNEFIAICLAYVPAIYCAHWIKAGKAES